MPDISNTISFDTEQATKNIEALSAALKGYNATVKKIPNTSIGGAKTSQALSQVSNAAQRAAQSLNQVANSVQNTANKTKKASNQMILSWQSVTRIFAIQVIHQAVSKITSTLTEATGAARAYSKQLAEIQTIGPGFKKDFAGLDDQVAAFSAISGFTLDESTAGLYQTLSNQVANAGDEIEFLGSAADLAVAGVADLDGSVNLLSSAINSYGEASSEAGDISGKLFKTIELGRLRLDDIADSYGRVLGIASQMGISLAEVNASMATLTSTGMDANEAMTLITNTTLKLAKPTKKLKAVFDDMGVSTAEAGIQAYGFQGFLEQITKRGGSSTTALGKLFGRVRAVRGALGLTNTQSERYTKFLAQIEEAGEETTKEAKKFIFETNAKQLELEFNKVSIAVTKFGQEFNGVLLAVIQGVGGGVAAIKTLLVAVAAGGATFVALKLAAGSAFAAMTTSMVGLTAATVGLRGAFLSLAASPVGIALAVAGVAAAVAISYYNMSSAAEKAAEKQEAAFKRANKQSLKDLQKTNRAKTKEYNKYIGTLQSGLQNRIKAEKAADEKVELFQKSLTGDIKDQMDANIKAFEAYTRAVETNANSATIAVLQLNQAISSSKSQKEDFLFDRQQKRFGDATKEVYARQQKSASLRSKSLAELRKGNTEEAKLLQERSFNEAKTALSISDQVGNRALIAGAEKEVERSYDNQTKLLKEKKARTEAIARISKQESSSNKKLLSNLKTVREAVGKDIKISADMSPAEVKAVEQKAKRYSNLFSSILEKASISKSIGKLDLIDSAKMRQDFMDGTKGAYDPLLQQNTTWEAAVMSSIDRIKKAMKAELPATTKAEKQAEFITGGGKAVDQAQKLLDLTKARADGIKAEEENAKALVSINEKNLAIEKAQKSIITEIRQFSPATAAERRIGGPGSEAAQKNIAAVVSRIKLVQQAQKDGLTNTEAYKKALEELNILQEAAPGRIAGIFGSDMADNLAAIINKLQETEALQQKIRDNASAVEVGEKVDKKVEESKDIKINGDISGLDSAVNQAASTLASLPTTKTITIRTRYVDSGPANAYYGRMFRTNGGGTRGHDKIPAMLSKGEFVMNAGATRKMYSQLVGANATNRYLGGNTTTNNNSMTFNVNGSESPGQTAREIQKLIRRENRIRK